MEDEIWIRFLEFERKNQLFDIQDAEGTYVWDLIRLEVYMNVLWTFPNPVTYKQPSVLQKLIEYGYDIFYLLKYLFSSKKDKMYFITSRNIQKDQLIDQNIFDTLNINKESTILIEAYASIRDKRLKYTNPVYPNFTRLLRFFVAERKFDFSHIIALVKTEFDNFNLTNEHLNIHYNKFYEQKAVYGKLLKYKRIKVFYLVQNGIQKGVISACRELGIPVYEFQHGIVDLGHLAYSYPKIEKIEEKVYLPDKIASLSEFWFSDCYLPSVKILPIGNNSFYKKIPTTDINKPKDGVIVISSDVFGEELMQFLIKLFEQNYLLETDVYFKLHPNQFVQKKYYLDAFSNYPHVQIVTDQYSLEKLFTLCDTLFAIQSTAVYEALDYGLKGIILKRSSYKRQLNIFTNENIYLIDNVSEFIFAHKQKVLVKESCNIFKPFDENLFRNEFLS